MPIIKCYDETLNGTPQTGRNIAYDNAGTQILSTTVQGAITELNSALETVEKTINTNNFASPVTLAYNTDYVVDGDGYVNLYIKTIGTGNNKFSAVFVNNVRLLLLPVAEREYNSASIFVKKGMTIKYANGDGITDRTMVQCSFYKLT